MIAKLAGDGSESHRCKVSPFRSYNLLIKDSTSAFYDFFRERRETVVYAFLAIV